MIFAGIDIGSNAVRILFSNVFEGVNGVLVSSKAAFVRVPLRLGEDVFSLGYIRDESEEALKETLLAFKQLIKVYKTTDYAVCATAAMREASNSQQVVERIREATGMDIRIVDGLEEAQIIRTAGEIQVEERFDTTMYVDVGGGSTEISITNRGKFQESYSFKLGTLRLLHQDVASDEFVRLNECLHRLDSDFGKIELIGSGGNINKIHKLFGEKTGQYISYSQLKKGYKKLEAMTLDERMSAFNLRPDRADVIQPAAKIFLFIAKHIGADRIIVPKFGLADGLVCMLYRKKMEDNKEQDKKNKEKR